MKTRKVESKPDLVRDMGTGAILNTNIEKHKSKERMQTTYKRIDALESDLDEIKNLLKQLIEK